MDAKLESEGSPPKTSLVSAGTVVVRWVLAGVFIYMGLTKALHPEEFLKLVRQYQLVNQPFLLNSIAAALPWFEVFCGLLLLFGIAVRGAALMLILMLIPFSLIVFQRAVGIATTQGLPFCAVKFNCGCGNGEVFICHKLLENGLLLLLAAWVLIARNQRFCAQFNLFATDANKENQALVSRGERFGSAGPLTNG